MRAALVPALVAALAAPAMLASADPDPVPAAPCADTAAREMLSPDGFGLDFLAPAVTAPELAATNAETGDVVTPHRTAHFFYTVDAAPFENAEVTFRLEWAEAPSDYDMFLFYGDNGFEAARSTDTNIEDGDTRVEEMTVTVGDCQTLDLAVRSWAGSPAQTLSLDVTVTPTGEPAEGVLPRPADDRTVLYLGGSRPGNAATPYDFAGDPDNPFQPAMSEERPSANVPNHVARPVVGSTTERNPFQPWWGRDFGHPMPMLEGTPSALVFINSKTEQLDPGTVFVQLFLNGTEHTVEIPGAEIGEHPRPYLVEFPDVAPQQLFSATLQVTTHPIASPNTASEHLGDANHEVWFDSVQYQARLVLPLTDAG